MWVVGVHSEILQIQQLVASFKIYPAVGGEWMFQTCRVGKFLGRKVKIVKFAWGGNQP